MDSSVLEKLSYNPCTGVFTWRDYPSARRTITGSVAGSVKKTGYRFIQVGGRIYKASRLAWYFVHGQEPVSLIDHINGDRDDNRIINLRQATHSENAQNRSSCRGSSSSKKGVTLHKSAKKWQAQIKVGGKNKYLGLFVSEDEAARAYDSAAKNEFGEFSRLNERAES